MNQASAMVTMVCTVKTRILGAAKQAISGPMGAASKARSLGLSAPSILFGSSSSGRHRGHGTADDRYGD